MTARVLVVDDHALLAQSLTFALRARGFECRAASLGSVGEVVAQVREMEPDLVMLDMQLGGALGSGVDLVEPLTHAGTRVLVVSGADDPVVVASALESGAVGFVAKSQPFDVLVDTVALAAQGSEVLSAADRADLLGELRRHRQQVAEAHRPFLRLTPREEKVLEALCAGRSVSAIASDWFVSVATVRSQVRSILHKLDVGSQLEAVTLAHQVGWAART